MIVDSAIVWALEQEDDRLVVRESFTDNLGRTFFCDYVAEIGTDIVAKLANRVLELNSGIS